MTQDESEQSAPAAARRLAEAFDSSVIDALLADAQATGTPIDGADGACRHTARHPNRALDLLT